MYNVKIVFSKLSENLRKLRINNKLSQLEVSIGAKVSRTQLQSYESKNNSSDIRLSNLIKLANYYKITIEELIE